MTLFEEYPDKAGRRRRTACCDAWATLAERFPRAAVERAWPWVVLHEMAHSRVPFSVRRFSYDAHLPLRVAAEYIEQAREWRWLDVAPLEVEPADVAPFIESADDATPDHVLNKTTEVDVIKTTSGVLSNDDTSPCWDTLWLGNLSKKR